MDYHAKRVIWEASEQQEAATTGFLLEPICVFLDQNKLTSDRGELLQFWVHKQLARTRFYKARILFEEFD